MDFVKNTLPGRKILPTLLGLSLLFYLCFHILQGERGLLSYPEHVRLIEAKKAELAKLLHEKEIWERRVVLLQREGLDYDMLEERARAMLNFTRPDEVIILIDE